LPQRSRIAAEGLDRFEGHGDRVRKKTVVIERLYDSFANVDPQEAYRAALDAGIVVHRIDPLNGETPLEALRDELTPNARFYVRNHFGIPNLDASSWRLHVGGLVQNRLELTLNDLQNIPAHERVATLECAGNGRASLEPQVAGEPWRFGAVSAAQWTGVPLVEVLDRAGIKAQACELVFRGADRGQLHEGGDTIYFERSLSVETARSCGALLAYAMNGEPLPPVHGYPLRVVVPGWYAMASVKWLTEIEAVSRPFTGHYQSDTYFFEAERDGRVVREPARLQRVRSLILEPAPRVQVARGELVVRGVAWSGAAPIVSVEVSVSGGPWQKARCNGQAAPGALTSWEAIVRVDGSGEASLRARATDQTGATQPETPPWNRLGYGNNAVHEVRVQAS